MMHTIMPLESVFPQPEMAAQYKYINSSGVDMMVEQLPNGQKRIERILSTNPLDFLNPMFQPGNII